MGFTEEDLYNVLASCPEHFASKYYNMVLDWCLDQYEVLIRRNLLGSYDFSNEKHFRSIVYVSVERLFQNHLRDTEDYPEFCYLDDVCPMGEDGEVDMSRCSVLADDCFDDFTDGEDVFADLDRAWLGFRGMDPRAARKMYNDLPEDIKSYFKRPFVVNVDGEDKVLDHIVKGGIAFTDGTIIKSAEGTSLSEARFGVVTSFYTSRSKLSGYYSRFTFE